MNEQIKKAIDRLRETLNEMESWDRSYWSARLGTSHLKAYAEQVVNDAKTLASLLKAYGER